MLYRCKKILLLMNSPALERENFSTFYPYDRTKKNEIIRKSN